MPASDGCIVGACPSNILYFCVSPVITWFVVDVVAFAIEVYDERLTSPDNSTATGYHFGQKEHIITSSSRR